jgi:hypothetical protein
MKLCAIVSVMALGGIKSGGLHKTKTALPELCYALELLELPERTGIGDDQLKVANNGSRSRVRWHGRRAGGGDSSNSRRAGGGQSDQNCRDEVIFVAMVNERDGGPVAGINACYTSVQVRS